MSVYVPVVKPLSRAAIEQDAIEVIERFYPHLLQRPGRFDVLDFFDRLADDYDLDPGVEHLSDGIEGMTWPDGRVLVSEKTYRGADAGIGRDRFTVPHECYHGIKHRDQIRQVLIDTGELVLHRRKEIQAYRDPEWQANTFASAVLMPAAMVERVVNGRPWMFAVADLTKTFGVSRRAAEVRLQKLGL